MIIGTTKILTIGPHVFGLLYNEHRQLARNQPATVLREATKAEWIAWAEEAGAPISEADRALVDRPETHFYKISID